MTEFLVVYDYGTGGVWGFATATSPEEVESLSPELKVIHERPAWMTDETEARARAVSSFVVGNEITYPDWLRGLIERR